MFLVSSLLLAAQSLIPKEYSQIMSDVPTNRMISTLRAQSIVVPLNISSGNVLSTYGYFPSKAKDIDVISSNSSPVVKSGRLSSVFSIPFLAKSLFASSRPSNPPIVLLHGFDSSCLEFRKLAPLLAETADCEVYAPDILGWGFLDHSNVTSFTPDAKIQHLASFLTQVVKRPCVVVGASLVISTYNLKLTKMNILYPKFYCL